MLFRGSETFKINTEFFTQSQPKHSHLQNIPSITSTGNAKHFGLCEQARRSNASIKRIPDRLTVGITTETSRRTGAEGLGAGRSKARCTHQLNHSFRARGVTLSSLCCRHRPAAHIHRKTLLAVDQNQIETQHFSVDDVTSSHSLPPRPNSRLFH